jgi:hypothetical protein
VPEPHGGPIADWAALDELEIGDLLSTSADRAGLEARLGLFLDGELTLRELST